jgi:precorrin-6B methylase 2
MIITILFILQYIFLLGILAILGYLAFIMTSFRNTVPYVPTPRKVIKQMITMAEINKGERIVDLGSGTGRIIISLGKKHRENLIIGIERSFILRVVTKLRLLFHPFIKKRIQILNQDFFNTDLAAFDVIFCFSTPTALRMLTPKFKLLKSGSRIISYMFPIEDSAGFNEETKHLSTNDIVYLYKKS